MTARSVVHHALTVYYSDTDHTGGPEGIADQLIDNLIKESAPVPAPPETWTYMVVDTLNEAAHIRQGYTTRSNAKRAALQLAKRLPYQSATLVYRSNEHQDHLEMAGPYVTEWVYKEPLR